MRKGRWYQRNSCYKGACSYSREFLLPYSDHVLGNASVDRQSYLHNASHLHRLEIDMCRANYTLLCTVLSFVIPQGTCFSF